MKTTNPDDLKIIPGVGKDMERHFFDVGVRKVSDLIGADPEELFRKDCEVKGLQDDRCVLYVFRLAVYYANNEIRDPEKLKWYYWKDEKTR